MKYIPPFEVVKKPAQTSTFKGELVATLPYKSLLELMRYLLSAVEVDEAWYLKQYPDVMQAIAKGAYASAKDHYVQNGYFESRLPFPMAVNEKWYCEQYSDVAESIRSGKEPSAQAHFYESGYREGRLPAPATR